MSREDCDAFLAGRPGDGVMRMPLAGWRPPLMVRIDARGAPARDNPNGDGHYRFTSPDDAPRLRAMDATARCDGDGHYDCKGCIYFRSRGDQ